MKQLSGLITKALAGADLTEAFKTKGDLKRWSAKRTVGGMIATGVLRHHYARHELGGGLHVCNRCYTFNREHV